jgi:hypothetical protein
LQGPWPLCMRGRSPGSQPPCNLLRVHQLALACGRRPSPTLPPFLNPRHQRFGSGATVRPMHDACGRCCTCVRLSAAGCPPGVGRRDDCSIRFDILDERQRSGRPERRLSRTGTPAMTEALRGLQPTATRRTAATASRTAPPRAWCSSPAVRRKSPSVTTSPRRSVCAAPWSPSHGAPTRRPKRRPRSP